MLYVSHRLEEVFAICNRITVTRNGRDVLTRDRKGLTIPEVIEGMIGTPQTALFPPPLLRQSGREPGAVIVKGLSGGALKDVAFTAQSGEVVGFAGLEGSGVATLFGMLFGTQKARAGDVIFSGLGGTAARPHRGGSPRHCARSL